MSEAKSEPACSERYQQSHAAHQRARTVLTGGVNSPVRAYQAVGREPITIQRGEGCRVTDVDGNDYIDYVGSFGPLIAGHAHPSVVAAVTKAARHGTSFGMPTLSETQLAEMVVAAVQSVDVVRFVNSGTEAVMSTIRLARGATGRSKVVKCVGGYHGHVDGLLVQAGSGATTLGVPSSPGIPDSVAAETCLVPYNDAAAVKTVLDENQGEVACVIVEPVAGNMGCVPPAAGYLEQLRQLCDEAGVLLVFDEVMTGFRVAYGGAQGLYGVRPDLTVLGKIIGGGLPCAAYGGSSDLMRQMAPEGAIYQAGTLSGNPVAMAAGQAMLTCLQTPGSYKTLEATSAALEAGLRQAAGGRVSIQLNRVGSMLTLFFNEQPVVDYATATASNTEQFACFFQAMLDQGVVLPPSQFEAWFVSLAHDQEAIDATINAATIAMDAVAEMN